LLAQAQNIVVFCSKKIIVFLAECHAAVAAAM
jgi:hypothetical protein